MPGGELTRRSLWALTNLGAFITHPVSIHCGLEIGSDLADGGRSVILEQVTNGLAVRMAVLFLVNGDPDPQEIAAG